MKSGMTKGDWKNLWAILWRMLLFGPVLLPLGFALLLLISVVAFGPICYGLVLILGGHTFWGCTVLAAWLIVLRMARPVFRRVFDGIKYAGV
jgi:hypothetical protein